MFGSLGPKGPTGTSSQGLIASGEHWPHFSVWVEVGVDIVVKGRGGHKRASAEIRLFPCVVPRPSLHAHSPFKNQNK